MNAVESEKIISGQLVCRWLDDVTLDTEAIQMGTVADSIFPLRLLDLLICRRRTKREIKLTRPRSQTGR